MKFLADECCEAETVSLLRSEGHDVAYIPEVKPGATDSEILSLASEGKRLLLTEDKDFGELVFRLKKPAIGIILLRFDVSERKAKWNSLISLVREHGERIHGNFVTVDAEKSRFRPLHV